MCNIVEQCVVLLLPGHNNVTKCRNSLNVYINKNCVSINSSDKIDHAPHLAILNSVSKYI